MLIRIGTRKSKLAKIQTELVIQEIKKHYPQANCQIVPMVTSGDLIADKNLYDVGGKALFLKELESALLQGKIDIAVHSLKDVPGRLPPNLTIEAVLPREDPRDVLVSHKFSSLEELPDKSTIGTSALRRKILLNHIRPDLNIIPLRGNVDSRLKKLAASDLDAIIVAAAGLKRLGLFDDSYCSPISTTQLIPAVGQGVIAVEIIADNQKMLELCHKINHHPTWQIIEAERAFIEYLDADCKTPIAAYAQNHEDNIAINFMMSDFTGSYLLFHKTSGNIKDGKKLAVEAAKEMLKRIN